jgi:hypothetical protein
MTAIEGENSSYYHSQGGLSKSMRSMSGRGSLGLMSAGNASGSGSRSRMSFEGGRGGGEALSPNPNILMLSAQSIANRARVCFEEW